MEKTNSITYNSLVVSLSGAPTWGIMSSYMLRTIRNNTIISMIIGFIIGFFIIMVYLKYFDKYKDKNLCERNKMTFGKASIIVNIIFIIITFIFYVFLTYRLTSFLSSQYLVETKKIFLQLLLVCTTVYIAYKGTETIGRVSLVTLFISIFLFLFDIFSLVEYIRFDNFLPIYNSSIKDIIVSSLFFAVFFSMPTVYATNIKKDQIVDKDKYNLYFYSYYSISFIPLLLAVITTILIYGNNLVAIFDYPLYSVLKRIQLFSFIESIENVSMILWMIYIVNSGAIMFYSTISLVKGTFKIKNEKYVYIVLLIFAIIIPQLFLINNNFEETKNYLYMVLTLNVILFLFILIGVIKRKKLKK